MARLKRLHRSAIALVGRKDWFSISITENVMVLLPPSFSLSSSASVFSQAANINKAIEKQKRRTNNGYASLMQFDLFIFGI